MKSGNLNFLEPFGPLQACNGTALPLPLHLLESLCVTVAVTYVAFFVKVRYLKIIEKSGYQALPWVRYITQNGDYQLRTN